MSIPPVLVAMSTWGPLLAAFRAAFQRARSRVKTGFQFSPRSLRNGLMMGPTTVLTFAGVACFSFSMIVLIVLWLAIALDVYLSLFWAIVAYTMHQALPKSARILAAREAPSSPWYFSTSGGVPQAGKPSTAKLRKVALANMPPSNSAFSIEFPSPPNGA
jgi:hypothetical protein